MDAAESTADLCVSLCLLPLPFIADLLHLVVPETTSLFPSRKKDCRRCRIGPASELAPSVGTSISEGQMLGPGNMANCIGALHVGLVPLCRSSASCCLLAGKAVESRFGMATARRHFQQTASGTHCLELSAGIIRTQGVSRVSMFYSVMRSQPSAQESASIIIEREDLQRNATWVDGLPELRN